MLTIKQHGDNWRIVVKEEVWKFETRHEMELVIQQLLNLKEKFGKLNE